MQKTFVLSCIVLIALLFTNSNVIAKTKSDAAAIRTCIENNIKAMQDEDIDAFWAVRKPETAQEKEELTAFLKMAFENYDFSFKIESYKLIKSNDENAHVVVVVVTKKIRGSEFKDNRSKSQYFLKKFDGCWYIVKAETLSVEYLESSSADNQEQNRPQNINQSDAASIRKCIEDNLKATDNEDIDAFWATCNPAVPRQEKEQMIALMKSMFEAYDLSREIESYKLLKSDNKNALVEVVQITKKIRGPKYQDNRTRNLHYLQKIDGKWYIIKTEVMGFEYLD